MNDLSTLKTLLTQQRQAELKASYDAKKLAKRLSKEKKK
jgi:hypothetical protein